jgi:hypothetical protein
VVLFDDVGVMPRKECAARRSSVGGFMGLGIALIDFKCEVLDRVDDPHNSLHRLLPPADEESPELLARIDWFGDTYFNYLQMKNFLDEWDRLGGSARSPEEETLLEQVRRLAVRCQIDREILRFIGD